MDQVRQPSAKAHSSTFALRLHEVFERNPRQTEGIGETIEVLYDSLRSKERTSIGETIEVLSFERRLS